MSVKTFVLIAACVAVLAFAGCQKESAPVQQLTQAAPEDTATVVVENAPDEVAGHRFQSSEVVTTDLCAVRANDIALSKRPTQVQDVANVRLHGWFGDEQTMAWPGDAKLYIVPDAPNGSVWSVSLAATVSRGDVARNFNASTMRDTGFDVSRNLSQLPAGNYRLVLGFEKDGKHHRCDRNRVIRLG